MMGLRMGLWTEPEWEAHVYNPTLDITLAGIRSRDVTRRLERRLLLREARSSRHAMDRLATVALSVSDTLSGRPLTAHPLRHGQTALAP
jgi:hypothetical protein